MAEIVKSSIFEQWLTHLKDDRGKAKIQARIRRLSLGNPGDVKPVGDGISELRIDYGPGYRIYYLQHGMFLVVLLCGGDKATQSKDIVKAKSIAQQWKGEL